MKRTVRCVAIGDSLLQVHDDNAGTKLGGIVGRLADWALSQGITVKWLGLTAVQNHLPADPDPQYVEYHGGYELTDYQALLGARKDSSNVTTNVPLFSSMATSIYQPIDLALMTGGGGSINNVGLTAAQINAQMLLFLRTLRLNLNAAGQTKCKIAVMGGYTDWGPHGGTNSLQATACNSTINSTVYDAFDAEFATQHLVRGIDWTENGSLGPWNATDWDDTAHFNANGFARVTNDATKGTIAVLGPVLLALASSPPVTMGTLSTPAKNMIVDHDNNVTAITPEANFFLHLYADAALTVPLTPGTASGYAALSKANNNTNWATLSSGRVKVSPVAWVFGTPSGNWPAVYGWKLTNSATEGAGTVYASNSHTPVTVGTTNNGSGGATGPFQYDANAITLTAAAATGPGGVGVVGMSDAAFQRAINRMFGAVADTPDATRYRSYWTGPPPGGTQQGARVAVTQASAWGAASGGVAQNTASITLTQQASADWIAEHTLSSGGVLTSSAYRPASVGASGTILPGQLRKGLTD